MRLRSPWRPGKELDPCIVQVVEAREIDSPQGAEPIHWVLLTDWPCETFQQAMRVIKAYTRRWLIEEYHKCLKSGTGIEQSQLATAQHITGLLAILAVVAVRLAVQAEGRAVRVVRDGYLLPKSSSATRACAA